MKLALILAALPVCALMGCLVLLREVKNLTPEAQEKK